MHPKLSIPLLIMILYSIGLVWFGRMLRLWNGALVIETVVWFVGSALVLFFNLDKAARTDGFFFRAALRTLEVTVLAEFFLNTFVLNLVAELILQPVLMFLAMLSVFSEREERHRPAKILADWLLAIAGIGLAVFSLVQFVKQWDALDKTLGLLELVLPVWLTLALLPFIFLMSLYVGYEGAFTRVNFTVRDRSARRRAKIAVVLATHVRIHRIGRLPWSWPKDAGSARSLIAAWREVRRLQTAGPSG